jgi:hypothetical protein
MDLYSSPVFAYISVYCAYMSILREYLLQLRLLSNVSLNTMIYDVRTTLRLRVCITTYHPYSTISCRILKIDCRSLIKSCYCKVDTPLDYCRKSLQSPIGSTLQSTFLPLSFVATVQHSRKMSACSTVNLCRASSLLACIQPTQRSEERCCPLCSLDNGPTSLITSLGRRWDHSRSPSSYFEGATFNNNASFRSQRQQEGHLFTFTLFNVQQRNQLCIKSLQLRHEDFRQQNHEGPRDLLDR